MPNDELYSELRRLAKMANQRILRLEREFGSDIEPIKKFEDKLISYGLSYNYIDLFKRYIYSDGSNDNTGLNRLSNADYLVENVTKLILNKCKQYKNIKIIDENFIRDFISGFSTWFQVYKILTFRYQNQFSTYQQH